MFDFIVKTFTSFFVAVGIANPVVAPEPIITADYTDRASSSVPTIQFISENTVVEDTISEEERLRQQAIVAQQQREQDLEEARKLRAIREAQIAAERKQQEVQAARPQQTYQPTITSAATDAEITAERAATSEYSRLVNQYTPLLNAWRDIINTHDIEYLAAIVNERIIIVRTINALAANYQYSLPASYAPVKSFYENLYTDIEAMVPDILYARSEITSLSRYIEAQGGFSAPGISEDAGAKNVLRTFVTDARLSNPEAFAAKLATHKAAVGQLDGGYKETLRVVEADLLEYTKAQNVTSATRVPCWQLQTEFKEDWEAINERYTAQDSFFSSNRTTEVTNLRESYKEDYPACF